MVVGGSERRNGMGLERSIVARRGPTNFDSPPRLGLMWKTMGMRGESRLLLLSNPSLGKVWGVLSLFQNPSSSSWRVPSFA